MTAGQQGHLTQTTTMPSILKFITLFVLFLLPMTADSSSTRRKDPLKGWRMVDRFGGFRFECAGDYDRSDLLDRIHSKADELAAFGWAQISPFGNVVGEFRGSKTAAKAMTAWFITQIQSESVSVYIHQYADTKIKLHFSTFKILPAERKTCFEHQPHQCSSAMQHTAEQQHSEL